eukprot:CFRG1711T1
MPHDRNVDDVIVWGIGTGEDWKQGESNPGRRKIRRSPTTNLQTITKHRHTKDKYIMSTAIPPKVCAQEHISINDLTFVDTHTHLDMILKRMDKSPSWYPKLAAEHFAKTGLEACIHVSCSVKSFKVGLDLVNNHEKVYGAFGVHPKNASEYNEKVGEEIERLLKPLRTSTADGSISDDNIQIECFENGSKRPTSSNHTTNANTSNVNEKSSNVVINRAIAWGECGLDYSQVEKLAPDGIKYTKELQRSVFVDQIKRAVILRVPLVVHTRDAEDDTLTILNKYLPVSHPTHIHCFTSHLSLAQSLLETHTRMYFGFTGAITFKNAHTLRDTVRAIPLNKLLLETDGPYMAPAPFRGQVCLPSMIPYMAKCIADVKGVSINDVLIATRENTRVVYGI